MTYRETTIWDVRNKKISWERVETPEDLTGIAVYGPRGVLFTIGRDHIIQQYELYPPALAISAQHIPTVPPPSPPVSIGDMNGQFTDFREHHIERYEELRDDDYIAGTMSPLGRIAHELEQLERMEAQVLGAGQMQRSISASSAGSRTTAPSLNRRPSVASTRSIQSNNSDQYSISDQHSIHSVSEPRPIPDHPDYSFSKGRQNSVISQFSPGYSSPGRRPHPLAQEIVASPIEKPQIPNYIFELFPNLRARLPLVTYSTPRELNTTGGLNEDDLRREMLSCVFGWKGDVDSLIRDECEIILSPIKWQFNFLMSR